MKSVEIAVIAGLDLTTSVPKFRHVSSIPVVLWCAKVIRMALEADARADTVDKARHVRAVR